MKGLLYEVPILTDEAFEEWYKTAKPKDQFVYAKHFNLGDSGVSEQTLALASKLKLVRPGQGGFGPTSHQAGRWPQWGI